MKRRNLTEPTFNIDTDFPRIVLTCWTAALKSDKPHHMKWII